MRPYFEIEDDVEPSPKEEVKMLVEIPDEAKADLNLETPCCIADVNDVKL